MSKKEYEELLDRVHSQLPSKALKRERFELPEPVSLIMGNKTVLKNFKEICDRMSRTQDHLLKFLSKELATAGMVDGAYAVFQGKFNDGTVNRLIDRYVNDYLRCSICNRPDTKIVKEGRFHFLICEACGAKSSIRGI